MATVVIHAGMPKTGSTSIQRWIIDNATRLRSERGIETLVATGGTSRNPTDQVRLEPYDSGPINSGRVIREWLANDRSPTVARRFIGDLSVYAGEAETVLVTGEALSQAFWREDETFLGGFEELASVHDVRVAYYVRPQHTSLEAGWREGGFKDPKRQPSEWVVEQCRRGLHYLPTLETVDRVAPRVDFGMRPFVAEVLDGSNPVEDFVHHFLHIDEECRDVHVNPGLPLELVNLLRHAPDGWFWKRLDLENYPETYPRWKFAGLFAGLDAGPSARIARSRRILRSYCRRIFEAGNRRLINRFEWPLEYLVPPGELVDDPWTLDELDDLWAPDASEAERALLYRTVRAALT